jgi:hypothetical protein
VGWTGPCVFACLELFRWTLKFLRHEYSRTPDAFTDTRPAAPPPSTSLTNSYLPFWNKSARCCDDCPAKDERAKRPHAEGCYRPVLWQFLQLHCLHHWCKWFWDMHFGGHELTITRKARSRLSPTRTETARSLRLCRMWREKSSTVDRPRHSLSAMQRTLSPTSATF